MPADHAGGQMAEKRQDQLHEPEADQDAEDGRDDEGREDIADAGHDALIEEQTRLVLDYIGAKLKSRGLGYEDVVMSTVFMKNLNDFATMNRIYAEFFKTAPPSRATVEVARLPRDVLIEIAVVAAVK